MFISYVIEDTLGLRYIKQCEEWEIKGVLVAGSFGPLKGISSVSAAPGWLSAAPLHLALFLF